MNLKENRELIKSSYYKYTDKKYNFFNRIVTNFKRPGFRYIYTNIERSNIIENINYSF